MQVEFALMIRMTLRDKEVSCTEEETMVEASELRELELFSQFSDKLLEELARITEKRAYKTRSHVYNYGDQARFLFVVSKGTVSLRALKAAEEEGVTYETRTPGDFFGAASFMKPQQYTLTAVCLEDTEVFAIDGDKLSALCENDPKLGYELMKKIAMIYFERFRLDRDRII